MIHHATTSSLPSGLTESEGVVWHRWGQASIGAPHDVVVLIGWGSGGSAGACHCQSRLLHHGDIAILSRHTPLPPCSCKEKRGTDRVDPTQGHPAAPSTSSGRGAGGMLASVNVNHVSCATAPSPSSPPCRHYSLSCSCSSMTLPRWTVWGSSSSSSNLLIL